MTERFSFGNVSGPVVAGTGNTVAGRDQVIAGRDLAVGRGPASDPEIAQALAELRRQLEDLRLTDSERAAAEAELEAVTEAEDEQGMARHLEDFVSIVTRAGVVLTAGSAVVDGVMRIATRLGPLASGVLALVR